MSQSSPWPSARLAVLAAFFINGAFLATWVSRIPALQEQLGLSEGALGFILLGLAAGVIVALSLAGGLIARFGSAKVTAVGLLVMGCTLPLLALAPQASLLWLALFVYGGAMSAMDVAMNAQAVQVEQNVGRPLMSSFHAAFSIGGLTGALFGAGLAFMPPIFHFLIALLFFGSIALFAFRYLQPDEEAMPQSEAVFQLPPRALWLLGAIAFCSSIGEGSVADWSAVYLRQTFRTSASFAALGFAAFSLTMTGGRLLGDGLAARYDAVQIVRWGGLIATVGILAVIITEQPLIVLLGFAGVGAGLANIIPLSFSAAGKYPGIPSGVGIAGVATIGYAGFLAGPPAIGLLAEATSLRIALLFVAILVGSLIFTASAIRPSRG